MAQSSALTKTRALPLPTQAAKVAVARLAWVDDFRGIAILLVVLVHACSSCQKLLQPSSTAWLACAEISRLMQFAVPAFLMLSAMLLGGAWLREANWKAYLQRRTQSVAWPLLLWNLLCIVYIRWQQPGISWRKIALSVWTGEQDFHLYYLRVLLQLCLAVPFAMWLLRGRPAFRVVGPAVCFLTVAIFLGNRFFWHNAQPASWIFWHIPPVALGLWLATQSERWPEIAERGWRPALFVTAISLCVYLPMALRSMAGEDVRSALFPLSCWAYGTGASFLLFCAAVGRPRANSTTRQFLQSAGRWSMQIYLLHPVVLVLMQKQLLPSPNFTDYGISSAFTARLLLTLLLPMSLAWLLDGSRLSKLMFGR